MVADDGTLAGRTENGAGMAFQRVNDMVATLSAIEGSPIQERVPLGASAALRGVVMPAQVAALEEAGPDERPVDIQISDAAQSAIQDAQQQAATMQAFSQALQQGLVGFSREATRLFTLIGMNRATAGQAVAAVTTAIREATGSPSFRGKVLAFHASDAGSGDGPYRASLIIEKAALAWDPGTRGYVTTVRRMSLTVGFEPPAVFTPRGVPAADEVAPNATPVLRFDARIPMQGPETAPTPAF